MKKPSQDDHGIRWPRLVIFLALSGAIIYLINLIPGVQEAFMLIMKGG